MAAAGSADIVPDDDLFADTSHKRQHNRFLLIGSLTLTDPKWALEQLLHEFVILSFSLLLFPLSSIAKWLELVPRFGAAAKFPCYVRGHQAHGDQIRHRAHPSVVLIAAQIGEG